MAQQPDETLIQILAALNEMKQMMRDASQQRQLNVRIEANDRAIQELVNRVMEEILNRVKSENILTVTNG